MEEDKKWHKREGEWEKSWSRSRVQLESEQHTGTRAELGEIFYSLQSLLLERKILDLGETESQAHTMTEAGLLSFPIHYCWVETLPILQGSIQKPPLPRFF